MDDIEKNDNMGAYELGGSSCPCENFKCPCAVTGGLLDQQYDCDIPTGEPYLALVLLNFK